MIAGSNPNLDRSTYKYPTEYRVEWLSPPYIGSADRPVIDAVPTIANFAQIVRIKMAAGTDLVKKNVKVVVMDFGFGESRSANGGYLIWKGADSLIS